MVLPNNNGSVEMFFFVYYHVGDLYLIIFFQPIFTLRVRRSNSQNDNISIVKGFKIIND